MKLKKVTRNNMTDPVAAPLETNAQLKLQEAAGKMQVPLQEAEAKRREAEAQLQLQDFKAKLEDQARLQRAALANVLNVFSPIEMQISAMTRNLIVRYGLCAVDWSVERSYTIESLAPTGSASGREAALQDEMCEALRRVDIPMEDVHKDTHRSFTLPVPKLQPVAATCGLTVSLEMHGSLGDIILHIPNCTGSSVLTILCSIFELNVDRGRIGGESALVVHRNRLAAMVAEAKGQPTEGAAEAISESHMPPMPPHSVQPTATIRTVDSLQAACLKAQRDFQGLHGWCPCFPSGIDGFAIPKPNPNDKTLDCIVELKINRLTDNCVAQCLAEILCRRSEYPDKWVCGIVMNRDEVLVVDSGGTVPPEFHLKPFQQRFVSRAVSASLSLDPSATTESSSRSHRNRPHQSPAPQPKPPRSKAANDVSDAAAQGPNTTPPQGEGHHDSPGGRSQPMTSGGTPLSWHALCQLRHGLPMVKHDEECRTWVQGTCDPTE